ncbi:unnamed protein product [Medioppia subpectinata]|uniref:Chitin-binding type-2 domain-containing protein n=1 Tax=Medioppia subpectinata TaxID=1979941 RepID=A0A7R9KKK9_9ACAR|nr:unnamed protein product [Medioppia subpectinata]CAG2104120.1 unnamed protein product [Medioppia subpectinata]
MAKVYLTLLSVLVLALFSTNLAQKTRVKRQSLAYRFASGVEFVVPDLRESFTCENRDYGYYADVDNNCQVFHVCVPPAQHFSFFCPNTTIFDQRLLVCNDELFATPCREAERFYVINQNFGVTDPDKLVQI